MPATLAKLDKFDCLILDDLDYGKDQAETAVLFDLIAERYERKSLIITCNQPFSEWNQVFPDPAVTVAAIDRLVHHSTILEINTESYRRRTAAENSAAANTSRAKLPDGNTAFAIIGEGWQSGQYHARTCPFFPDLLCVPRHSVVEAKQCIDRLLYQL
jgi:hypothetical protein